MAFQRDAFQNDAFQTGNGGWRSPFLRYLGGLCAPNPHPSSGYIPQLGHKKKRKGQIVWLEPPKLEPIAESKPETVIAAPEAIKEPPRKLTSFAELGETFAGQALVASTVAENARIATEQARVAKIAKAKADLLADDEEIALAFLSIN